MSGEVPPRQQRLAEAAKRHAERRRRAKGIPSLASGLGRVGVLGWQIVVPALIGLGLGRWLDQRFTSGIFWTAPLLILGIVLGCWSAWTWIARQ